MEHILIPYQGVKYFIKIFKVSQMCVDYIFVYTPYGHHTILECKSV